MEITLGNMVTLSTTVALSDPITGVLTPTDDPGLELLILKPDGTTDTFTGVHDGLGQYHYEYLPLELGAYTWRWAGDVEAQGASEGTFEVTSIMVPRIIDRHDVRVLVPRCRRAVEGVQSEKWVLTDGEVKDLVADACADVLLYTGSLFGSDLLVLETDINGAPTEYATSVVLTIPQGAVIAAQAALTYFYHRFAGMKVQEQISDEASHWQYALSPNLLIAQLKLLQDTRDKALEAVAAQNGGMDTYISFLALRDTTASRFIEPWVYGHPEGYGLGAGGLEGDWRFDLMPGGGGNYSGVP